MRKLSQSKSLTLFRDRLPWLSARRSQALRRPPKNLSMVLREWHKRIGIVACVFMLWLGVSGVMLNQSPAWGLDAKRIDWPWLMSLYGLHTEPPQTGFSAGTHWLAAAGDALVLDGAPLDTALKVPVGFVAAGIGSQRLLYVASPTELVIATTAGKRVDDLSGTTLPVAEIQRLGVTRDGSGVVIDGRSPFVSLDGGLSWQPASAAGVRWSQPGDLSPAQRDLAVKYARPSVPIEQILIDFHSGRIFGHAGEYVIDAIGIAAILLAISGIWIVLRANRRRAPGR